VEGKSGEVKVLTQLVLGMSVLAGQHVSLLANGVLLTVSRRCRSVLHGGQSIRLATVNLNLERLHGDV
jgi:hypothetical protein